jgi:ArsR family transcriptional regulator
MAMLKQIEETFKIFADRNRIRIVNLLARRRMCVCELAYVLGVSQPSVSRHLRKMKQVGLIADEQEGYWTNYYLLRKQKCCDDILCCLEGWGRDARLKADLDKLNKADRKKICCR